MDHRSQTTSQLTLSPTIHCLTGCAIGEILGLVIATQLGWHDLPSIALAIVLAFVFGYSPTLRLLHASGVAIGTAARLAFAADTLSITVMEIVDNAIVSPSPARWRCRSSTRCSGAAMASGRTIGQPRTNRARARRMMPSEMPPARISAGFGKAVVSGT